MSKIATISAYAGFTRNLMRQHLAGNRTELHEHLMRNPELHEYLRHPELRNVFLRNHESTLLDAMKESSPPEVEVDLEVEVDVDEGWEAVLEWLAEVLG